MTMQHNQNKLYMQDYILSKNNTSQSMSDFDNMFNKGWQVNSIFMI
jgi:hypothetical protein